MVEADIPATVLVVDGEVIIRTEISAYLRDCGYRVIEAATSDEALHVLSANSEPVKIILTDVQLPGSLDGFGLARWVRSNKPGVGVVLAGTAQRAAVAAGELCEDGPTLSKPYDPQIVADRIKRLLGTTRP
jgi:DNA-binding response OmpR family regulator